MTELLEIWEKIQNLFLDFHWIFAVEAVFLCIPIYFVFKILSENNAKPLIFLYVFLILMAGVVCVFLHDHTIGTLVFYLFFFTITLLYLSLFATEIKRDVWSRGKHAALHRGAASPVKNSIANQRAEENVASIVRAVQNLSKSNTGALIVLSNGNLPKEILDSGTRMDSDISSQLIEGIFIPKAPLHDGAMIVNGDKIEAAGCFLPLSTKEWPKEYGTRHRAGIGVTEAADVSTIIVSEETGIVSVVKHGAITRYVDSTALRRFLENYYWKEFNGEAKKS